jgi:hypothetical protein
MGNCIFKYKIKDSSIKTTTTSTVTETTTCIDNIINKITNTRTYTNNENINTGDYTCTEINMEECNNNILLITTNIKSFVKTKSKTTLINSFSKDKCGIINTNVTTEIICINELINEDGEKSFEKIKNINIVKNNDGITKEYNTIIKKIFTKNKITGVVNVKIILQENDILTNISSQVFCEEDSDIIF